MLKQGHSFPENAALASGVQWNNLMVLTLHRRTTDHSLWVYKAQSRDTKCLCEHRLESSLRRSGPTLRRPLLVPLIGWKRTKRSPPTELPPEFQNLHRPEVSAVCNKRTGLADRPNTW